MTRHSAKRMGVFDRMATIGVLPLGRETFDVPFAEANLAAMLSVLEASGHRIAGPQSLLFDAQATTHAIAKLKTETPDHVIVLQVTFTDASTVVEVSQAFSQPLSIWAVPEPREGGRLRLNSFCGLNLAAHALGLNNRPFGFLYASPDAAGIENSVAELLASKRLANPVLPKPAVEVAGSSVAAEKAVSAIRGARIGRIGEHPAGFDTCSYDQDKLKALAGIQVDEVDLESMFVAARAIDQQSVDQTRAAADRLLDGLEDVDQEQLDRSLRLKGALEALRKSGNYDSFAIRCWPETFTEYGGAVCGPVSMLGEARVPCACEADVYGAVTLLLLQTVAGDAAFLTDLVDLDVDDDTGVVWHCGQAPISMADPAFRARATVHTNRKMPLLFEFPLKPGRVTFFRLSQARGQTMAVIGGGDMLERPMAFTGTSGVVRFDNGARTILNSVMGAALEHHMALVYGDHRNALRAVARQLGIPVLEV